MTVDNVKQAGLKLAADSGETVLLCNVYERRKDGTIAGTMWSFEHKPSNGELIAMLTVRNYQHTFGVWWARECMCLTKEDTARILAGFA